MSQAQVDNVPTVLTMLRVDVDNALVMSEVRARGELIRTFILENVGAHPNDIVRIVCGKFGISRQAASRHIGNLVEEQAIIPSGETRSRTYRLAPQLDWSRWYDIAPGLSESDIWSGVSMHLDPLPENVRDIWQYGFTEMFNNIVDHSGSTRAFVRIEKAATRTRLQMADFGVGIFRKISQALGLVDERHAVLELAKGKFTTDPKNHSGEGIFFTSRVFDQFQILSGDVYFSHKHGEEEDWILGNDGPPTNVDPCTMVTMLLGNHTARRLQAVFDEYADVDYGFNMTVVPVALAQYGDDKLMSRSQAKRLLVRFDRFRKVVLDFTDVETIGQSFADEIFRVFANSHPDVELVTINVQPQVEAMIKHVRANAGGQASSPMPDTKG